MRPDGVVLAGTAAALFGAEPWDASLTVTAAGEHVHYQTATWSGAASTGVTALAATSCTDWTSASGGDTGRTAQFAGYTDGTRRFGPTTAACNDPGTRLYCLQL